MGEKETTIAHRITGCPAAAKDYLEGSRAARAIAPASGRSCRGCRGEGRTFMGIPACPGLAVGPAHVVRRTTLAGPATEMDVTGAPNPAGVGETADEAFARLRAAIVTAAAQLERIRAEAGPTGAGGILEAQMMLLDDPKLLGAVRVAVAKQRTPLERAVREAAEGYARRLEELPDVYVRERAADVRDVGQRLLWNLAGVGDAARQAARPVRPSVVVADDLVPSQTAGLDPSLVLALVTEKGSPTSHTAILARAKGIPAVTGVVGVMAALAPGQTVAVDGSTGTVEVYRGSERPEELARSKAIQEREAGFPAGTRDLPASTRDGRRIEVDANIGRPEDVAGALTSGAEGSGLVRTEFLFMAGHRPPSEEEQFAAYRAVLAGMEGRPVVIRTLDIGGDKDIPYLGPAGETNPFLGRRGLRLCLERPDLLRTQLRAIYRASAHGRARVMFPMVSTADEVRRARAFIDEVVEDLKREGRPYDPGVEVGVMIETPSAALTAAAIGREVDFLSIGTNDLTQYTLAVDRTDPATAHLCDAWQPAVLRLVAMVADAASSAGIWVGVCGELASDSLATSVLIGLGITELSVNPSAVPRIKKAVRLVDFRSAEAAAREVLELPTADEVRHYLLARPPGR